MCLQLLPPCLINDNINFLALDFSFKWPVKSVKNYSTHFDCINDIEGLFNALNFHDSIIMLLASGSWVDCRLVQDQKIWHIFLEDVLVDI